MKGYRTYAVLATQFIAATATFLYQFGIIVGNLTPEQIASIEGVLTFSVMSLVPVAAYFRSIAKTK